MENEKTTTAISTTKPNRQGEGGGPKTEEGKARSSMNGLKHGKFMKRFERIGELAGTLQICTQCGYEQQQQCQVNKQCAIWEEKVVAYHLSHEKRDPNFIEQHTLPQLAMMDMILDWKLNWVAQNLGEVEDILDQKGNIVGKRQIVGPGELYELINSLKALNKTPADLHMTRATLEQMDVEYAKLLEAQIDPEKAEAHKEAIIKQMQDFRDAKKEADKMRSQDQAIQEFIESEGKTKTDEQDNNIHPINSNFNPFRQIGSGKKQD